MVSKNDVTGDEIKSVPSKRYQDNYDAVFRSNRKSTPDARSEFTQIDWQKMCDVLLAEKIDLLRQIHALQSDAQRWRWWREKWVISSQSEPHTLDKAVDDAMRVADWPDEVRIDVIGQNGNTGEHYD